MDIDAINDHIQQELRGRGMDAVAAVEAATWLDAAGLLSDSPNRPGLPLRNLLRDKRIVGQRQEANHRWFVDEVTGEHAAREASEAALTSLVEQAIATTDIDGLERLRGYAIYDSRKDDAIKDLDGFGAAVSAIASTPLVATRYGLDNTSRLALQFVYEVGARLSEVAFDESVVSETWDAFCEELDTPEWVFRGLANMRNFQSDELMLDLGDGVSIRGRNFEELEALGFGDFVLTQLEEDWHGFGASSYVMVVESRVVKSPDNFILSGDGATVTSALRALGALRLLAPGDVGFGRMWFARPMRFNVGIGGVSSTGSAPGTPGAPYTCSMSLADQVREVCERLRTLEENKYAHAPGNLGLALRSFMATYDRWPWGRDSQLLDSITALEAVLGTESEIAYKLASRVSALLGEDEDERVAIFESIRGYYKARSQIVHGSPVSKRNREYLERVDDLRDLVRRQLLGFVTLATNSGHPFDRSFFEGLDSALLRSADRDAFRAVMTSPKRPAS